MRRQREPDRVVLNVRRDDDFADQLLQANERFAVDHFLGLRPLVASGAIENDRQLLARGIADDQLEHEAVELRLGKRVGPFLFDGILGRHDEERLLEPVDHAADGDGVFLHRFQERGLRFGRRAVDFVGQDDLREDGPALKFEFATAVGLSMTTLVPRMSAGIRSGVNWTRLKSSVKHSASVRTNRFCPSRARLPKRVAADEETGQDSVNDLVVADDHLGDFVLDPGVNRPKFIGSGFDRGGIGGQHRFKSS